MNDKQCYTSDPKAVSFVSSGSIKFDEFVLDRDRYELHRGSENIKLEKNPMELLILLINRDGKLVTRQEIIDLLWGKDVFVDTEHGINTAIRKVRQALKDDPERPRFVQTVTGKGYRFIAECTNGNGVATTGSAIAPAVATSTKEVGITPQKSSWRLGIVGVLVVCVIFGAALALDLGGLRGRIFSRNQIGPIHSIAVLPLTNLSGDPSQDYFSDGMTDEMITALAENHSLRVVSRTSAMQFKGVNKPIRDIAQALGVDGILEGSVMRSNNQVRVNLQLIYAPTDTHVWAQSYERDLKDAISLPEEISQTIANEAKVGAVPSHPHRYVSPEAHEAYLHGRYFWYELNFPKSLEYLQKATQLQPDYAAAWGAIGEAYIQNIGSYGITVKEGCAKGEEAVKKAMSLDDATAEIHNSMAAFYLFCAWDFPKAEEESLRTIQLDPNYAEGRFLHSQILLVVNRNAEALEEGKKADQMAPFERPWGLSHLYMHMRRYDDAIRESKWRIDANPSNPPLLFTLSEEYWLKGMYEESEQALEQALKVTGEAKEAERYHHEFAQGGEKARAHYGVSEILKQSRKEYVSPWDIAYQYAYLRDEENTIKYLQAAYSEHSNWLIFLQCKGVFDFLHSDERYRTIVRNVGLPPSY